MKKFLIIFFILALGSLAYFGYPIVKKRYFTKTSITETPAPENVTSPSTQDDQNSEDEDVLNENDQTEEDIQSENTPETNPVKFLKITSQDCDENCQKYKNDQEDLQYCQETCGLAKPAANQDGCSLKEGLEADYCFKDLAVSKKDFKICDKIKDAGIKKTCENRITEDLINGGGGPAD